MNEAVRDALVEEVARGDSDALQRLLVHYHMPLRREVESRIDAEQRRHLEADDVLQQAYISAFQAVSDCEYRIVEGHTAPAAGFYRWLETITLNSLKDCQRALLRQKRDVRREVVVTGTASATYPDLANRLTSDPTTPSRQLAKGEAVAALISSLARLQSDQREVIRLRFLEGRSVAEVARHLGKTEGAVHTLCYRGLKSLRGIMVSITRYLTRI